MVDQNWSRKFKSLNYVLITSRIMFAMAVLLIESLPNILFVCLLFEILALSFTGMLSKPNFELHLGLKASFACLIAFLVYIYGIHVVVKASGRRVSLGLNYCLNGQLGLNFSILLVLI